MSILAFRTKKTLTIGDVEFGIRKLSWKSLDKARMNKTLDQAQAIRAYGGDVVKGLRSEAMDEAAKAYAEKKGQQTEAEKKEEHYNSFDRGSILIAGVERCSEVTGGDKELREYIDELDDETAEVLHREIVDLSVKKKGEAEGKGVSGTSIGSSSALS